MIESHTTIWTVHRASCVEVGRALTGVLEVKIALYALGLVKRIILILILEKRDSDGVEWIGLPQDRNKHQGLV